MDVSPGGGFKLLVCIYIYPFLTVVVWTWGLSTGQPARPRDETGLIFDNVCFTFASGSSIIVLVFLDTSDVGHIYAKYLPPPLP